MTLVILATAVAVLLVCGPFGAFVGVLTRRYQVSSALLTYPYIEFVTHVNMNTHLYTYEYNLVC